jgi:CelD/BcsL family acetyltransferase involved in cellulose biosynthesis
MLKKPMHWRRAAILATLTDLRFQWVTDLPRFLQLRDEWNALGSSAIETVFLTHDWLATWAEQLAPDAELHVLTAWSGDSLVAALPLFGDPHVGRGRRWAFMGTGTLTPNHLDVIARPDVREAALAGFAKLLLEESPSWDILDLDKLPAQSDTAGTFATAFAAAGLATTSSESALCYVCDLPTTYEDYLASRSKSTRKKIGETRRWLKKQPPTYQLAQAQTEAEALRALDSLERFHQARWEGKGYPGAFADARVVRFHDAEVRAALQSGYLRMYTLADGDQIIAVSYNYRIGATAQAYLTSFDAKFFQSSPGVLLRAYVIERLIAEGVTLFDWLEGAESYKKAWCTHEIKDLRLQVFNRTLAGHMARMKRSADETTVRLARRWVSPEMRQRVLKIMARFGASRATEGADS